MPSITYNRTDNQQPQSIVIKGLVIRPGLQPVSPQQMKLVRDHLQRDQKLAYMVSQGVIELSV